MEALPKYVEELIAGGLPARYHVLAGQPYVEIERLDTGGTQWNKTVTNILITIPTNFDLAGTALDAFYVEADLLINNQKHPRVQADEYVLDSRRWRLVSWHYNKSWEHPKDNLQTHVFHCRQFFKQREKAN